MLIRIGAYYSEVWRTKNVHIQVSVNSNAIFIDNSMFYILPLKFGKKNFIHRNNVHITYFQCLSLNIGVIKISSVYV
jgi:hypothetical protein